MSILVVHTGIVTGFTFKKKEGFMKRVCTPSSEHVSSVAHT